MIQLTGVSRRFPTEPPIEALVGVNLAVQRGEWISIVGPSGSGKSTLMNVIGCLDRHTSGRYLFDGIDVDQLSDRQRAGLRSRSIGFVFQSFHLLPHRSVIENVMLAEIYRKGSHDGRRDRAAAALGEVGLAERAEFLPTRLSGGERQRAAIARALTGKPTILLCDEPTGNLDSATSATILRLFEDLHRAGLTVVMITHDRDVADWATRTVQIIDGRLIES